MSDKRGRSTKWKWTQASIGVAMIAFVAFTVVPRTDPTYGRGLTPYGYPFGLSWPELCGPTYLQRMIPAYPEREMPRLEMRSQIPTPRDAYYDDVQISFQRICQDPARRAVTTVGAVALVAVLGVGILEKTKHA